MKIIVGTGDLYRGDIKIRRVKYEITHYLPEPIFYNAMGGGGVVDGLSKDITGRFYDIDNSGDFWDLFNTGEILTVRFDKGGFWECYIINANGDAHNAGHLECPPEEII
jgi:hypothetical protein